MSKCSPRPCELPKTTWRHRQCVVVCRWCSTLYRQVAHGYAGDIFYSWEQLKQEDAKLQIGFHQDG